MPRNQFERMMFALMTVLVTVHAYVFYSLYVINGSTRKCINGTPIPPGMGAFHQLEALLAAAALSASSTASIARTTPMTYNASASSAISTS